MSAHLSPNLLRTLQLLRDSSEPLSGRAIAGLLGVTPNTSTGWLRELETMEAVDRSTSGRSNLWTSNATAADLIRRHGSQLPPTNRTVVVATALPLEFAAVRSRLLNLQTLRSTTGVRFVAGTVSGPSVKWTVYVAQVGMGNASTAAFIGRAASEFNADLCAFVGIAAGLKPDDQMLGDVIAAGRAYNALSGKETKDDLGDEQFLARPISRNISKSLEQLILSVTNDPKWNHATARRAGQPKAWLGAIASVESVQASADSRVMSNVRTTLNDAIGLDMESFGLYEGAHELGLSGLSVRGISDFVSDKAAQRDSISQPTAAMNAADLFVDILRAAHPDDVPSTLEKTEPPEADALVPAASHLPPFLSPYIHRFQRDSPQAAAEALHDIQDRNLIPLNATWLNRALHRPPAWLREDETGAGWAMVAQLASAASLTKAAGAYARAADAAEKVGDDAMAFALRLSAAQSEPPHMRSPEAFLAAMDRLRENAPAGADPILDFYSAGARLDVVAMQEIASAALMAVNEDPVLSGLPPASSPQLEIDHEMAAVLATGILIALATGYLTRMEGESALRIANRAHQLSPYSTGADLVIAQARLARLLSSTTRPGEIEDASSELKEIERIALHVRLARRAWGGPTDEALALAGRARAQGGDPQGALQLLRAAPFGSATPAEASSSEVVRVAAMAATLAGDLDLVLQYADLTEDSTEAEMLKASVLSKRPGASAQAEEAYRRALHAAGDRIDVIQRALFGLAEAGALFTGEDATFVSEQVDALRARDDQAAELTLAINDLESARLDDALRRARQFRGSVLAAEIEVSALVRSGEQEEAVRLLDRLGRDRGDHSVRVQALMLAGRSELDALANEIASDLAVLGSPAVRAEAVNAKMHLARRGLNWREMENHARQLIGPEFPDSSLDQTALRWLLIEALFYQEKFKGAVSEILAAPQLPFSERGQVQLLFAAARGLSIDEGSISTELFELVLAVAAAWVDDAQVAEESIATIITVKVASDPTEAQLRRAGELQEQFFAKNAETSGIKRLSVTDDDISELTDHLRQEFEPREEALNDLTSKVWLGQFPAAILADATGRSYAEILIRRSLGLYVVGDGNGVSETERAAAKQALDGQKVVVDTSALVVAPLMTGSRAKTLALFGRTILSATLRDDIHAARTSLAMKSTATIGWDSKSGRPTISSFEEDQVEAWAQSSRELQSDLRLLNVVDDPLSPNGKWDLALGLARQLDLPLWVDDSAIRAVAGEFGVRTFGSLALLEVLAARGQEYFGDASDIRDRARKARLVDLEGDPDWAGAAFAEGWDPGEYVGLHISRPSAWRTFESSFRNYQRLVRALPASSTPEQIANWAANASRGLAWASPTSARPSVVGGLLAWTALSVDTVLDVRRVLLGDFEPQLSDGKVLAELLHVGLSMQDGLFPDGDVISEIVDVLRGALVAAFGSALAARVIANAFSKVEEPTRSKALAALLSAPYDERSRRTSNET